jgi:hypothetical protein
MRIFVSAAAAAMLAAATPAHADVMDFDGAEIVVGAPASYCVIGEGQFSVLGTLLLSDDPGDILAAFAPCEDIDEVAAGSADTFRHYGLIVGLRDETGEAVRPGKPLEDYFADFDAEQFKAQDAGARVTAVGMNSDHAVQIEPVGLVSKIDQAHFAAMTIRPQESGRPAVAAVVGRTLIDGRVVQVELYGPEDEAPIPELIVLGHETVAALWEANVATAGSGTVTVDANAGLEASGEMEEEVAGEAAEDDSLAADDALSEEEDLAAAFEAMSALAGESFQTLYWLVVGYLSASILLGLGIFGWFKLRPEAA